MKIPEKKQKLNLLKFLTILYGKCGNSGFMELRPMTADYKIDHENREWIRLNNKQRIIEQAWNLRDKRHLFFGVGTRTKQGKKKQKGSKRFVKEIPALFCDLDFEDFSGGKEEAKEFIDDFILPESIRVFSGHGYHLYFLLKKPYNVQEQGTARIEEILGVVQDLLFGDKTSDVSRILRLPYSTNIKEPSRPVLTSLDKIKNKRYQLQDFIDQFWHRLQEKDNFSDSKRNMNRRNARQQDGKIDIDSLKVSDKIKDLIKNGNSTEKYNYPSRSEADMAVITGLLSSGYSNQVIERIFNENPSGIGEKYYEKGKSKDKYIQHSIKSAIKYLSSESKRGNK